MHIGVRKSYLLPPHPGLGQLVPALPIPSPAPATVPSDPLYARILMAFGQPLIGAASMRIAGGGAQRGGGYFYPDPSGGGVFGFEGLSQSTVMMGAVVLGALFLFSRR